VPVYVEEAVEILWRVIDEAKGFLMDPKSSPADKKAWAKVPYDMIGVLNKLLAFQKSGEQIGESDLIKILEKVSGKYSRMVIRLLFGVVRAVNSVSAHYGENTFGALFVFIPVYGFLFGRLM